MALRLKPPFQRVGGAYRRPAKASTPTGSVSRFQVWEMFLICVRSVTNEEPGTSIPTLGATLCTPVGNLLLSLVPTLRVEIPVRDARRPVQMPDAERLGSILM